MIHINRKSVIFTILLTQTFLAILCGFFVLSLLSKNKAVPNICIENTTLERTDKSFFLKVAKEKYDGLLNDGFLTIALDGGKEYKIKYSEIGAYLDYDATYAQIESIKKKGVFSNIITSYFVSNKLIITPVVKFNEDFLGEKLKNLSYEVYKKPLNVDIALNNGKIKIIPEVTGLSLNILNSIEKIRNCIGFQLNSPIRFSAENNFEIEQIKPQFTTKHLSKIKKILSTKSTNSKIKTNRNSAILAANAINKVIIPPNGEFSFNKYLNLSELLMQKNNEGYNQIVSTLYSAVLLAGINEENTFKTINKAKVDYIDIKEAIAVRGEKQDFLFKNTLNTPIMIYSEVNGDTIGIYILGE